MLLCCYFTKLLLLCKTYKGSWRSIYSKPTRRPPVSRRTPQAISAISPIQPLQSVQYDTQSETDMLTRDEAYLQESQHLQVLHHDQRYP